MKRFIPILAAGLMLAPLGGCVSLGGAEVPDSLLTLTPDTPVAAGASANGTLANAIAVIEPGAPQRLNVTRVPVQVNEAQVAYLEDAIWVEKPTRLFRRLLSETIAARGNRLVIDGASADLSAQTKLYGTLLDMGYDVPSGSVVVRYEAIREYTTGEIETRRFESIVPGIAPTAGAVGPALNQASNDVARQIADWIG